PLEWAHRVGWSRRRARLRHPRRPPARAPEPVRRALPTTRYPIQRQPTSSRRINSQPRAANVTVRNRFGGGAVFCVAAPEDLRCLRADLTVFQEAAWHPGTSV